VACYRGGMAFLRDQGRAQGGSAAAQDHERSPGKSTLVDDHAQSEGADVRESTAHTAGVGVPYSLAYIAVTSFNHAAGAMNSANGHTKSIGYSLSGNLFTNPFYPLRGESFANAAAKVRTQQKFDRLWAQYNHVCHAPVVQAPMAEARTTGKLPQLIVQRLKTLLSQAQALKGFVEYLVEIGQDASEPFTRAQEMARAAEIAYENSLVNSIKWAQSEGDSEAKEELDTELEDAEAL
jgi:hypothetical protein